MFADPDATHSRRAHPRGIDVGAKYEIYCIMNDLIAQGKSVVMMHPQMPELLGMCDRIYVMNEGRIVAEFTSAEATPGEDNAGDPEFRQNRRQQGSAEGMNEKVSKPPALESGAKSGIREAL